jgi:DNA repair protein RecO (recombination protein O)
LISRCAATGSADDLIYVSPENGPCGVAYRGEVYRDRLARIAAVSAGAPGWAGANKGEDILAGLQLTQHFLAQWALMPPIRPARSARIRLTDLAARTARSA